MQSPLLAIYTSGIWGQYQYSHCTLDHLLHVKKDVESSQSAAGTIEALPSPLVPVEHSTPSKKIQHLFPLIKVI